MSAVPDRGGAVLALYDQGLPEVYGYLIARTHDRGLAEDLTSETFLAACSSPPEAPRTVAWLIGVARHKLADHWRWKARQQRLVEQVCHEIGADQDASFAEDPWDAHLDVLRARAVLRRLGPHHQAALTLRYLDGLSVPQTAAVLDRTVHATEALLVRARLAFRRAYESEGRADV